MKPILSESEDNQSLQALGRASVQIVHDIKNQLNGLKLYATFLRKRLEKGERPPDEIETVVKLIAGLDRTASDLSAIVEFGQPLQLKKQPGVDLGRLIQDVTTGLNQGPRATGALVGPIVLDSESTKFVGEFDSAALSEAIKHISVGAMKILGSKARQESLHINLKREATHSDGVIEWKVTDSLDHDPFRSFAGSDEIRMSLAAKVIEAHGGAAERRDGKLHVRLPLTS